jgi:hypothetical protein
MPVVTVSPNWKNSTKLNMQKKTAKNRETNVLTMIRTTIYEKKQKRKTVLLA